MSREKELCLMLIAGLLVLEQVKVSANVFHVQSHLRPCQERPSPYRKCSMEAGTETSSSRVTLPLIWTTFFQMDNAPSFQPCFHGVTVPPC